MTSLPLVSICCTSYNHEPFIAQAIEGFLAQKTNFPLEIIIHDDASTDKTAQIVKCYADKYPALIVPIFQKENQYSRGQNPWKHFVFPRARGKYIALCEGDDYWTDPQKLQKQIDFLEANPDYVVSCHDACEVSAEGKLLRNSILLDCYKKDFTGEELAKGNLIITLSMVYRNVIKELPAEYDHVLASDAFLKSLLGRYGKSKYHADIKAGVYRMHEGGLWSMLSGHDILKQRAIIYYWLAAYYRRQGPAEIYKHYGQKYLDSKIQIFLMYLADRKINQAFKEYFSVLEKSITYRMIEKYIYMNIQVIKKIGSLLRSRREGLSRSVKAKEQDLPQG